MSADIIQANYDHLEAIAGRFGRRAEVAAELHSRVMRGVQALEDGGWEGAGSAAFFAEMQGEMYPAMQRLIQVLEEARAVTLEVRDILLRAEEEAAAPFEHQGSLVGEGAGNFLSTSLEWVTDNPVTEFLGDLAIGVGEGAVDMVRGLWDVAKYSFWMSSPLALLIDRQRVVDTWQQTGNVIQAIIADPPAALGAMWDGIKAPYVEDWQAGRPGQAIGRGLFDVGSLFVGVGEIGAAVKGASGAGRAARILDAAGDGARALDAVADGARALDVAGDGARALESAEDMGRVLGARGPIPRTPDQFGTHLGAASGRPFFPDEIGVPIQSLSTERVRITSRGIDVVENHISRFGDDAQNAAQVQRLRDIATGRIQATPADLNFYTHELREFVRYRSLGYKTGLPDDPDIAHRLWNNAHTATLEDYGLKEAPGVLYHPSTYK